ncbi:MAG: PKD domain-containing protein, partial [Schleiferiaceae bacterium]|nr:PKD domain-containing protein [Schleiferiaceae bacterium]
GIHHARVQGYSNVGHFAALNQAKPNHYSFYFRADNSYAASNYMRLSAGAGGTANEMVGFDIDRNSVRVYHGNGSHFISAAVAWHFLELRNIDFANQTFDLYFNNSLEVAGLSFRQSSVQHLDQIEITSLGSGPNYVLYDEIRMTAASPVDTNISLATSSGTLSAGDSLSVPLTYQAPNLSAGAHLSYLRVETNAPGSDSLVMLPLKVTVQGTPALQLSRAQVNFDTTTTGVTFQDSLLLTNPSCVPLQFSSITAQHASFSLPASLSIPAYDSAYLRIDHQPVSTGLIEDTLRLTGTLDTAIALRANVVGAPSIAFDSSQYTVNSIGCLDSVYFEFKLYNQGQAALNWQVNSSTQLNDGFENGLNSDLWTASSTADLSNHCYVNSGSQSLSWQNGPRELVSKPLNLRQGDSVIFYAAPGNFSNPCESPDGGNENLRLQYRSSGGNWVTLITASSYNNGMNRYAAALPVGGSQMELRFVQLSYSGSTFDHWFVDDFQVGTTSSSRFQPDSGSTAGGDSVLISGYWDVAGLSSGTYQRQVQVSSNDVQSPDTSISVTLNVIGQPQLSTPQQAGCLNFATLPAGGTASDSLLIVNTGCDSLHFQSLSLLGGAGSAYRVPASLPSLASEDSLLLPISFAPARTQTGSLLDTLIIANNDSTYRLCLQGSATPSAELSLQPDSLSLQVNSCGDSITTQVSVRNTGADTLRYQWLTDSLGSSGAIEVTLFEGGVNSTEINNIVNVLQGLPNLSLTRSTPSQVSDLQQDLQGADVLIIPDTYSSNWSTYGGTFQQFRDQGKTVIIVGETSDFAINNSGLMATNAVYSDYASNNIDLPSHPVVAGLSGPINYVNRQYELRYASSSAPYQLIVGSRFGNRAIVSELQVNKGTQLYIGYDYEDTSATTAQLLRQAVTYGKSAQIPALNITAQPNAGNVLTGDSSTTSLTISTVGLANGTYDLELPLATNDPEATLAYWPIHLVVNGSAVAERAGSGCLNMGTLLQGEKGQDTARVVNRGCDTLHLTGFTVGQGTVSRDTAAGKWVLPGDTLAIPFEFSSSSVGAYADTLQVLTNDTTVYFCLNATINGAPLIDLPQDSIYKRVNKCKIIGNAALNISNNGLDTLDYRVKIGAYRAYHPRVYYNTSGASTQHSFTGLPTSADTLIVEVITYGDYSGYYDRPTLYLDNGYQGSMTNFNQDYVVDTIGRLFTGTQLNTWLADGQLDIQLNNSSGVNGGNGSFHKVNIYLKQSINWVSVTGSPSGSILPGNSQSENLLFNTALLPLGTHRTTAMILSNSGGEAVDFVPLVLEVVSEPEVAVSDTCLIFPLTRLGDTTSQQVTVYNNGCQPLSVSSIFGGGSSFRFSPSNASVPADDSLVVDVDFTPTSRGSFNSTLFLNNNDSNRTVCLQGTAEAMPVADFTISPENVCLGEISLQNQSQFFNSLTWTLGDGNVTTQTNPVHAYAAPGTYQITLRAANALGTDTLTKTTTVNPLVADFVASEDTVYRQDTIQFTDSTNGATSWSWDFGDGSTASQQNPSHVYSSIGLFNVRLTVSDSRACTQSVSYPVYVKDNVGLSEWSQRHGLRLYPNPAEDYTWLKAQNLDWEDYEVQLFNSLGQLVRTYQPEADTEALRLSTAQLAPGMYRVQVLQRGTPRASYKLMVR